MICVIALLAGLDRLLGDFDGVLVADGLSIYPAVPASARRLIDSTPLDPFVFRSGTATVQPENLDAFNAAKIAIEHVF